MAETDISFKVDLQGGEQTAAGLDKVTKALDDNADKQKKAADASVLHGTGVEKLSATMGLLGGAIGSVNPGLGSFVSTIGQSIGAVTQLEVAMGPLGIAIGVASAALALYTRSQADAKQATDAATQSLDAYISKIQQAARETERLGRLSTGAGTQLEYQARVEQLSAERSSAQDVLNPFSRSGFTATAADRENARQRIADLYGRALTHYSISQRVISGAASGEPPGPVTSIGKLFFCPLVEDIADFGLSLSQLDGQFSVLPLTRMPLLRKSCANGA